jgi:ribosomal protein L31E
MLTVARIEIEMENKYVLLYIFRNMRINNQIKIKPNINNKIKIKSNKQTVIKLK